MVQGKTKGLTSKASSTRHSAKASANTKKGKKYIAPKKPILMKQAQGEKCGLTAKINRSIEQQMVSAASSGKLTIMKHVAPEA
ncbi:hypothetical protein BDZ94DRAFT_1153682 [Collybia nuda]|uniref:Uncharacterized protein n=1 Tax=Collybia nuda TaxID=64659 RepID=A0A9P5YEL3_9AGAR|nr:hypothetical protein BDZ94DRAFT_1153682 [Collybia nuda]